MNKFEQVAEIIPEIDEKRIHVFMFKLDLFDPDELFNYLSEDEKQRADKLKINQKKAQFIITRALLRQLLSNSLEKEAKDICISYHEHCKPYINDKIDNTSIEFNVSHSGSYALIGLALNNKIGVDIEEVNPQVDHNALSNRFFSEEEKKAFTSINENEQSDAFYRLWTRKESFIKATGKGVAFGLDRFSVSLAEKPTQIKISSPASSDNWYCWGLTSPDNYKAALTVSSKDTDIVITELIN